MPAFVLLMNLTAKGAADIKQAPSRIDEGIRAFEAMGGKMYSFHVTMGPYDYVAIGEVPSDEVAAAFALALSAQGYVTTTSMRAYTREQFKGDRRLAAVRHGRARPSGGGARAGRPRRTIAPVRWRPRRGVG